MAAERDRSGAAADRQILVVGAGVAGLAAAAFLDRAGLSPVVVTSPRDRPDDGSRVVLWSSGLALLSRLDVAADLLAGADPLRRWELRTADGTPAERLTSAHGDEWPFVAVDRGRLRRSLRERLPSGAIRLSKTPRGIAADDADADADAGDRDGAVGVAFADGVSESFDAVVAADGPRSWVRARRFEDRPAPWGTATLTLRSDAALGSPGTVTELWHDEGVAVCGPWPGRRRVRVVTTVGDDPDAAATWLSRTVDPGAFPGDAGAPEAASVVGRRVDHGVRRERWADGRVAFVGAAARPLPPVLTVGPSLAVEDGFVLAAELRGAPGPAASLRGYADRRRGRNRTLARYVPLDDREPGDPSVRPVTGWTGLRAAFLRSFFGERVPAVSAAVARHV